MTSKPDADERLLDAHDLALAALREITPESTIGPAAGYLVEDDGSVSLRFENRLAGYPGWYWTVTVARVDDEEPTVLETELLPGDGALLAPEWVPWAERLAEYRAHQAELAEQAAAAAAEQNDADANAEGDAEDDDLDDVDEDEDEDLEDDSEEDDLEDDEDDDLDDDELTSEPRPVHGGDLDGVDIDELDDSEESADDTEDDSDDDALDEDDSDDDALDEDDSDDEE
ncbi:DUF3027 domain-containing protein [Microbacterium hydrocarbonoxydans]|uniref:DUF3027 domain-containing protein n=1 Tax=Microbacterium hydrocarbonoxydans TaxID=273678 RepID=UPI00203B9FEB|nr:DUF3027 domain-containing protein [Microbacterium hydrocarbonoxydans]MCM3780082.1 DUF3027 domain-containing protein [Microbacterium hydrocarbonoxydans]